MLNVLSLKNLKMPPPTCPLTGQPVCWHLYACSSTTEMQISAEVEGGSFTEKFKNLNVKY